MHDAVDSIGTRASIGKQESVADRNFRTERGLIAYEYISEGDGKGAAGDAIADATDNVVGKGAKLRVHSLRTLPP